MKLWWQPMRALASKYWGVAALLLAWQLWVSLESVNSIVMPSPGGVLSALLDDAPFFASQTWATAQAAVFGLVLGVMLGVVAATLCWFTPLLDGLLTPGVMLLRAVPIVAIIPIAARVFGYGGSTVLAISVMLAFFPSFVFYLSGLRNYSASQGELFSSLGCRARWRRFILLAAPAAVPNLATSLRLAAPGCMLGALVAEFLMGTEGLGYVMMRARSELMMERAWAAALIAMAASIMLYACANQVEARVRARWA